MVLKPPSPGKNSCSQLILFKPIGKVVFLTPVVLEKGLESSQLILFKPIGKEIGKYDDFQEQAVCSQLILFKPIGKASAL